MVLIFVDGVGPLAFSHVGAAETGMIFQEIGQQGLLKRRAADNMNVRLGHELPFFQDLATPQPPVCDGVFYAYIFSLVRFTHS